MLGRKENKCLVLCVFSKTRRGFNHLKISFDNFVLDLRFCLENYSKQIEKSNPLNKAQIENKTSKEDPNG